MRNAPPRIPDPFRDGAPSLLDGLPDWAVPVAAAGLGGLVLGGLLMRAVLGSMPDSPSIEEVDDGELGEDVLEVVDEYLAIGFRRIGPARRVGMRPSAMVVPMLHPERPVYATVYHVASGAHSITAWDCVSMLRHELSGLTTGSDATGGIGPAWPGALRQMLPGLRPAELLMRHEEATAFLSQQGLPLRAVRAEDFEQLLGLSLRLQRHTFLRSPVRNLLRCTWRAVTHTNPHIGALAEQAAARAQLAALRDGTWPDARARDALGA